MATVILVTGGCRSGKSSYAQSLCERLSAQPVYLATSQRGWDPDYEERIKRHQVDRGPHWTTVEEPMHLARHVDRFKTRCVLVDCLTNWLTNSMVERGAFTMPQDDATIQVASDDAVQRATEDALNFCRDEFQRLVQPWNATFVIVTNESGSGPHARDHLTRKFVDAQGWLNRCVAEHAQSVLHVVCGVPGILKCTVEGTHRPLTLDDFHDRLLDVHLSKRGLAMDAKGYFMIKVVDKRIRITFHSCLKNDQGEICDLDGKRIPCCSDQSPEPFKTWVCSTAKQATYEIFEVWNEVRRLDLSLGHAAYVAREVQRAQHCLQHNIPYQQD